MFTNIDWSKVVEAGLFTLAGAIGAAVIAFIGNLIASKKEYKKLDGKIGETSNTTLSGQHKAIESKIESTVKEHSQIINNKIGVLENTTLAGQSNSIIKSVQDVKSFLETEKADKIERQFLLSNDLRRFNNIIEELSDYIEIVDNVFVENSNLRYNNEKLLEEKKKLIEENQQLKDQLRQYESQQQSYHLHQDEQDLEL